MLSSFFGFLLNHRYVDRSFLGKFSHLLLIFTFATAAILVVMVFLNAFDVLTLLATNLILVLIEEVFESAEALSNLLLVEPQFADVLRQSKLDIDAW